MVKNGLSKFLHNSVAEEDKTLAVMETDWEEEGDMTEEILERIRKRPYPSRLFITSTLIPGKNDSAQVDYEGAFLRTHFSDRSDHASHLGTIRDYVWAFHAESPEAAKSSLSSIITACMTMDKGKYHSLASILASSLSEQARNTTFQPREFWNRDDPQSHDLCRKKFVLLMEIVFDSVTKERFLLRDKNTNIYRLCFCLLRSSSSETRKGKNSRLFSAVVAPFLCAFLQITLISYVSFEVATLDEWKIYWKTLPLAVLATLYSITQAYAGWKSTTSVKVIIYQDIGILFLIDWLINLLLPMAAVVLGFTIIATSDQFIEGVLNTAALLFIPEIDDKLPQFLDFQNDDIVRTYIVQAAVWRYELNARITDDEVNKATEKEDQVGNIVYSDIMVTNLKESGSDPDMFDFFGPIDVRTFATLEIIQEECLLKEVSWIYQPSNFKRQGSAKLSKGNVVYLRLVKLEDDKEVVFRNEKFIDGVDISKPDGAVRGVYILTTFKKARSVTHMRICGAPTGKQFSKALRYYNLWDISGEAQSLLDSPKSNVYPMGDDIQMVAKHCSQENFV
mmetsp:Transcript_47403/g.92487  ORF Transcript_47403/g.92487 Transcript_47403/m.92487 type:complete len:563 (+) Transcript_47403:204-1892(+)